MELGLTDSTIGQANRRKSFTLSPPPTAVGFAQAAELPDRTPGGDGLDLPDLANDLEIHLPVLTGSGSLQEPPNSR